MTVVETNMYVEAIQIVGRHRSDLGDLEGLAASIKQLGLINPITVTPDGRLLAGERRLAAFRMLGRDRIPVRIVDTLDDAADMLRIERDENTERKPMTPEELVRLGAALEEMERPRAAARRTGRPPKSHVQQNMTSDDEPTGRTREIVAAVLGMSESSYDRARTVVTAANDPSLPESDRRIAKEALADMNATGKISGNYDKVRKVRDARLGIRQKRTIDDAKKQRRAITAAVASLTGISYGLNQIEVLHPAITSGEAAQWVGDLSEARRVLEVLIKRLKERTNAQA